MIFAIIVTALVAAPVGAGVALALRQPWFRALEAETDQHAADTSDLRQQLDARTEELALARRATVVQMLHNAHEGTDIDGLADDEPVGEARVFELAAAS